MALTLWETLPEGVVEQRCWGTLVLTELNQLPSQQPGQVSSNTFLLLQSTSGSISGGLCLAIGLPRTVSSPSLPSGLGQGDLRHTVHGDGHLLGSQGWGQGGLNSLRAAVCCSFTSQG